MDSDEDDIPLLAQSEPEPETASPSSEGHDKRAWGDGPWLHEPDRVEWVHHGVPCLMIRHPMHGSWCGYVGVDPRHRWHGQEAPESPLLPRRRPSWTSLAEDEARAHGGITFVTPSDEHFRLLSEPGRFKDFWWLGFDCGHAWDLSPGLRAMTARLTPHLGLASSLQEQYRDVDYVRAQCIALAEQVIANGSQ